MCELSISISVSDFRFLSQENALPLHPMQIPALITFLLVKSICPLFLKPQSVPMEPEHNLIRKDPIIFAVPLCHQRIQTRVGTQKYNTDEWLGGAGRFLPGQSETNAIISEPKQKGQGLFG